MHRLMMLVALFSTGVFGASIEFQQGGWSDSDPLVVSFTGTDDDLDGTLLLDELTQFQASWASPGGTRTHWGLSEIQPDGFVFTDLQNYVFFVQNTDYSLVNTAFEGEALATVFDSLLFPVDSTSAVPEAVPEPGSIGLLTLGVAALMSTRLRRK